MSLSSYASTLGRKNAGFDARIGESVYWKVHLFKPAYKFSSAHLTIFPDGTKEALHGHNYRVHLDVHLTDASFRNTVPFSALKELVKPLCAAWDEKVLIAAHNPFTRIRTENGECEMVACGKRYVFPEDEVVLLDLENISAELLAQEIANQIGKALAAKPFREFITALEVRIEETEGQGTTFYMTLQ